MTPTRTIHDERDEKRTWAHNHYGIQTKIAKELGVPLSAVNAVLLYGLPRKDVRIERALIAAGCPHMKEHLRERLRQMGVPLTPASGARR
jgi:hypothetical protein